MPEIIPTEADREAAADSASVIYGKRISAMIRRGEYDMHHLVIAFARHTQAAKLEGIRIGLEAGAKRADETKAYDDHLQAATGCVSTGRRIGSAIRAIDPASLV